MGEHADLVAFELSVEAVCVLLPILVVGVRVFQPSFLDELSLRSFVLS